MGSRVREARGLGKVTNVILETGLTRLMSNHGLLGRGLWLRSCLACFLVLLPAPRDSDRGPLVALLLRGALGDLGALGTLGALGALGALAPGGRCRRLP